MVDCLVFSLAISRYPLLARYPSFARCPLSLALSLLSLVVGCWDLEILLSCYLLLSFAWVLAISRLLTIHRLLADFFRLLYLLLFLVVGC